MKKTDLYLKPGTYIKSSTTTGEVQGISLENFVVSVLNNPTCCPKPPGSPDGMLMTALPLNLTLQTVTDFVGNNSAIQLSTLRLGIRSDSSVTTQTSSVIQATTTNANLVIAPNGTGALVASIPDGTATGGNARGIYAIDLQSLRTLNTQVASGQNSVAIGINNTSSGTSSVVLGGTNSASASASFSTIGGGTGNSVNKQWDVISGGRDNVANTVNGYASIGGGQSNLVTSTHGTVSGGQTNVASTNTHATVVGGSGNTSSGQYAVSGGLSNTASGGSSVAFGDRVVASGGGAICMGGTAGIGSASTSSGLFSVSIGSNNIASADFSSAFGVASRAYLYGQQSLGSRVFGQINYPSGDGQQSLLTASRESNLTSGGTTILSLDGTGTTNFIIPTTNRVWNVKVSTVAVVVQITGTATGVTGGDSFLENRSLLLKRVSSTSSIVGVGTVEIISDTSMSTALMTYSVGASQQLQLTFNAPTFAGGGSLSIRVVSKIELVECQFG
jgi:hypothetical protein